jgi:hypothetical protein
MRESACLMCVLYVHKMHACLMCVLYVHKMHAYLMCVRCSQNTSGGMYAGKCMSDVCTMFTRCMHDTSCRVYGTVHKMRACLMCV